MQRLSNKLSLIVLAVAALIAILIVWRGYTAVEELRFWNQQFSMPPTCTNEDYSSANQPIIDRRFLTTSCQQDMIDCIRNEPEREGDDASTSSSFDLYRCFGRSGTEPV